MRSTVGLRPPVQHVFGHDDAGHGFLFQHARTFAIEGVDFLAEEPQRWP